MAALTLDFSSVAPDSRLPDEGHIRVWEIRRSTASGTPVAVRIAAKPALVRRPGEDQAWFLTVTEFSVGNVILHFSECQHSSDVIVGLVVDEIERQLLKGAVMTGTGHLTSWRIA